MSDTNQEFIKIKSTVDSSFTEQFAHFLTRTDTEYSKVPITFLLDRNIENRLFDSLVEYLPDGAIIAGGFMLSILQGDKNATDIDFFFTSEKAFLETVDLFLKRNGEEDKESWAYDGYSLKEGIDLEESLADPNTRFISLVHSTRPAVQLIKMVWYEDAKHVIDTFDFTIVQIAVTNQGLYFNPVTALDAANKKLVLHRLQFASSTLRRLVKYSKKGYWACPGSLVKICLEIQNFKGSMDANAVVYVD